MKKKFSIILFCLLVPGFLPQTANGKDISGPNNSTIYRVKSHRGTQFRILATELLQEYIIKGFTLDDQRLENAGGGNMMYRLKKLSLPGRTRIVYSGSQNDGDFCRYCWRQDDHRRHGQDAGTDKVQLNQTPS
jgi:hypothetical protein